MLFKKYSFDKLDFYLISSLTVLSLLSFNCYRPDSLWFCRENNIHETYGLFSLVEFIQLIVLLLNIFLFFKNRVILKKYSNNLITFAIRIFIPVFIIYEEMSFFFKDFFSKSFLESWNGQGEFNIHNSYLLSLKLFENNQYGENFLPDDIHLKLVIYFILYILLSFGQFLPFLKRFSFIFLEKRFLLFGLVGIFNILFSFVIRKFFGVMESSLFLGDEFLELFYYQLLLLDLREKIINSKI